MPTWRSAAGSTEMDPAVSNGRGAPKAHVWTAPAVQEEFGFLRSVRVQPCIRPVFAWRLAPLRCSRYGRWPRCSSADRVPTKSARSSIAWPLTGFPIYGLDRFASMSSSPLQFICAQTQTYSALANPLTPLPQVLARDRCRLWPATPRRCAPSCWPAPPPRP